MYIPLSLTESICTFTLPNSTWRSIFHSLATIFPACVLRCWKCTAECSPSSPLMLCVPSLPSNLHSWFFHFHLSPLLPYPLFPSHSVFLASCFPFLSSLMCLSSPLLPPTVFFFFSSHLHITELLLFSAASCAVGFSPILPPVFSVFPPCLSLRHCYYLFCPVCLIILFPPLYSSTFS